MATKKVFLTGASGYIGGDALAALIEAQPNWEFSILTRSKDQFEKIQKAHPQVSLVLGSLDDFETISNAAAAADVVVHTADSSDHQGAARAIAAGLRKGHSSSSPGYYIHISGTGILCWYDADNNRYGQPPLPDQIYDDLDGVDRLLTLPDTAFHRDVDKIVLEESAKDPSAVKVAIVCPPTIYGVGRGAINPKSRQVPMLIDSTIEEGLAPISGDGKTEWHGIHVQDLSDMIVKLAEHANLTEPDANDKEIWGPQGYFLCENEVFVWGEISKIVAKECYKQGLIKEEGTRQFTQEDAKKKGKFDWISWGQNSRGAARRGRKYLGWEPKKPSLEETIPEMVAAAAKAQK